MCIRDRGYTVEGFKEKDNGVEVLLKDNPSLQADMVVLAIGVTPVSYTHLDLSNTVISACSFSLRILAAAVAPPATPPTIITFILFFHLS